MDYWRQLDFYKPATNQLGKTLIVGCGATGSYVAYGLARMGVKDITICDHDIVEEHNLPNQMFAESLFKPSDLKDGLIPKVYALQKTLAFMMPNTSITYIPQKVETLEPGRFNIIIQASDSMDVRKYVYNHYQDSALVLIDPSTGGLFGNIYNIELGKRESLDYYKEYLNSSSISELPCTGRSIIDASMAISAAVIQSFRTYAINRRWLVMHAFHDWKLGQVLIMKTYKKEK
uniref:Putative ubiquitin activating domain contining protein n=1 Tax=viral metagenome TaxID=1070528 RepID=A0A6H1ZM71_9ZZZZ